MTQFPLLITADCFKICYHLFVLYRVDSLYHRTDLFQADGLKTDREAAMEEQAHAAVVVSLVTSS